MNENVGASFGLSLLVVFFFAVALYQPDKPAAEPRAKPPVKTATETAVVAKPIRVAAKTPTRTRATPARQVSRRVVEETSKRVETAPSGPRGAFTSVRDGERLEDVALRVYGEAGSVDKLWKANRDLVDRADQPLKAGMLVRTP